MDRSPDGAHGSQQETTFGGLEQGRRSLDPSSPRLQKKRSVRNAGRIPPRSSAGEDIAPRVSVPGTGDAAGGGVKARKGSLRNAVRKIFGRRSRDAEPPQLARVSPPRHTYHASEPRVLPSQPELPETYAQTGFVATPSLPDPLRSSPPSAFPRISSPSTGAFPNSLKLKPLDLGNPQIRRRKTLPNVQFTDIESARVASSPLAAVPPLPLSRPSHEASTHDALVQAKSIKDAKRRSRSAGDLRKSVAAAANTTARNRNEEIKFWRESFRPDVLRASGFVNRPARVDEAGPPQEEEKTPIATMADPFESTSSPGTNMLTSSPLFARDVTASEADVQSAAGIGTEMSKEIEDRVARLENGLRTFQRSLQRLTAERNRRTVVVGGEASPRSFDDVRTPSMLADTLQGPYEPSTYEYEYGFNMRHPSSSPELPAQPPPPPPPPPPPQRRPPQTPQHTDDPFGPELTRAAAAVRREDGLRTSSVTESQRPPPLLLPLPLPGSSDSTTQPQDYTFRSLYQMLNDERSARRRLETQLKNLQRDISDLSNQVAVSSNVQSQRSSYIHMDTAGGSNRLRELLRDTESSPPSTAGRPNLPVEQQRASGVAPADSPERQPVISRFSQSESEAGATEYEELETPLEAYQTPVSRSRSIYNLRDGQGSGSGDMF